MVRSGGRRTSPTRRALEGSVLVLMLGLALLEPILGVPNLSLAVAAGLFGLLLAVALRLSLAARPLLGVRMPSRPPPFFLLLACTVYLTLLPWSTQQRPPDGDEPWYLLVTHSLAYDFDAELSNNYAREDWRHFLNRPIEPQPGDPVGVNGELYSRHNLFLPLLLAVPYRLAGLYGALITMALCTALVTWLFLRLGYHYFPERPGETLITWCLLAFAAPLVLYSYQVWVEVPAALCVLVALDRIRTVASKRAATPLDWMICAGALASLPFLKIRFAAVAIPLVALAVWHTGPRRERRSLRALLVLASAVLFCVVGLLWFNQRFYGNPLKIHSWQELELHRYSITQYLINCIGIFWDVAYGLFAYAPLWLLVIPATVTAFRRARPLLLDIAVAAGPYLVLVTSRREWYGGWSPPFRYALVFLPLVALLLVPLLVDRRRTGARLLLAATATVTFALTLVWLVEPGWTYNFANGSTLALDALESRSGLDLVRLLPSSVRPRTATWLLPLGVTILVLVAWWWPPAGRPLRKVGGARRATAWGVAIPSIALLALLAGAARMPTRVIEPERSWVDKSGGHQEPGQWEFDRLRFPEAWVLPEGERLEARLEPGGARVSITLHHRPIENRSQPVRVSLRAGQDELAEISLSDPDVWQFTELGTFDWPSGEPLRLEVLAPPPGSPHNGVAVDKLMLSWQGR